MPKINSTEFGSITIDDKKYDQVLIIGNKVEERDYDKLKELFQTSHKIGDWEVAVLLKDNPEMVVIGTGQNGALSVEQKVIDILAQNKIKVTIEKTPQAVITYNSAISAGKRVNAVIHTTC